MILNPEFWFSVFVLLVLSLILTSDLLFQSSNLRLLAIQLSNSMNCVFFLVFVFLSTHSDQMPLFLISLLWPFWSKMHIFPPLIFWSFVTSHQCVQRHFLIGLSDAVNCFTSSSSPKISIFCFPLPLPPSSRDHRTKIIAMMWIVEFSSSFWSFLISFQ